MSSIKIASMIVLISIAGSLYVILQMPGEISLPIHWSINGQPDAFATSTFVLLMPPMIMIIITILMAALKYIEPRKRNLAQSRIGIQAVFWALMVLFIALEAGYLLLASDYPVSMFKLIVSALGLSFMIMGNYFGKVRSNFFIGIRTPWTLSSDTVWQKTHRLAGKLVLGAGLLSAMLVWMVTADFAGYLVLCLLLPSILFPAALSWWFWRMEQQN